MFIETKYPNESMRDAITLRYGDLQTLYCADIFELIVDTKQKLEQIFSQKEALELPDYLELLSFVAKRRQQLATKFEHSPRFDYGLYRAGPDINPYTCPGDIFTIIKKSSYADYLEILEGDFSSSTSHFTELGFADNKVGAPEAMVNDMLMLWFQFRETFSPAFNHNMSALSIETYDLAYRVTEIEGKKAHSIYRLKKKDSDEPPFFVIMHAIPTDVEPLVIESMQYFNQLIAAYKPGVPPSNEALEMLLKFTYYLDIATPWKRGSSEIVTILHMAARMMIGYPLKNIQYPNLIDRACLTANSFEDFSQTYHQDIAPLLAVGDTIDEQKYKKFMKAIEPHHSELKQTLKKVAPSSSFLMHFSTDTDYGLQQEDVPYCKQVWKLRAFVDGYEFIPSEQQSVEPYLNMLDEFEMYFKDKRSRLELILGSDTIEGFRNKLNKLSDDKPKEKPHKPR